MTEPINWGGVLFRFYGAGVRDCARFAVAVDNLGRCIAAVGAMQRAFDLGWERGVEVGDTIGDDRELRIGATWIPNIDGKAAP